MTRIIAGEWGGRKLVVPKSGTRPTSDRVREAIFSRLDHTDRLRGAQVVDLYAGSGALGLEALSRGAAEAVFVESSATAARVIDTNVTALGLGTRATVVRDRALAYVRRATAQWSIAFLDPPYDITDDTLSPVLEALVPRLGSGATVVLEVSARRASSPWPHGLEETHSKAYGDTMVHFAQCVR